MVESIAPIIDINIIDINIIVVTLVIFFAAALMEIDGGCLIWQWIREKKGILMGLAGGIILFVYGTVAIDNS